MNPWECYFKKDKPFKGLNTTHGTLTNFTVGHRYHLETFKVISFLNLSDHTTRCAFVYISNAW